MGVILFALAMALTFLSALSLYAGSPNCRWWALHRLRSHGSVMGFALAVVALLAWIWQLGMGAGLCAMLGTWMLVLMGLPYLAMRVRSPPVAERGEH